MPHSNQHPSGAKAPIPESSAVVVDYNQRSSRKKAEEAPLPALASSHRPVGEEDQRPLPLLRDG